MTVIRNGEAPWNEFDPPRYYEQYRGVIWEDRCLARLVIGALSVYDVPLGSLRRGLDVCNGGVLRGPALIAPYVAGEGVIDWIDYGKPQVAHAQEAIRRGKQGDLGQWAVHQTDMGACNAAWAGAGYRACHLGQASQGSIFELPANYYQIGITCFGPESLTADYQEWLTAVHRFIDSVEPGGPVVMLSMYGSTGYNSAGPTLPATSIGEQDILAGAGSRLGQIQSFRVQASHAARPADDIFTYEAMGGMVGIRQ